MAGKYGGLLQKWFIKHLANFNLAISLWPRIGFGTSSTNALLSFLYILTHTCLKRYTCSAGA